MRLVFGKMSKVLLAITVAHASNGIVSTANPPTAFAATSAIAIAVSAMPSTQDHTCMQCTVNGGPDEHGTWNLTWDDRCTEEGPWSGTWPGTNPPQPWQCAHCQHDFEYCIQTYEQWGWNGPCHLTCCPQDGDPYHDCEYYFGMELTDAVEVVRVLSSSPKLARYDVRRNFVTFFDCKGKLVKQARPPSDVRDAILRAMEISSPATILSVPVL